MQYTSLEPSGFVAMLHEGAFLFSRRKVQGCIYTAYTIGYMTDSFQSEVEKVVKNSSCHFRSDVIMYLVS